MFPFAGAPTDAQLNALTDANNEAAVNLMNLPGRDAAEIQRDKALLDSGSLTEKEFPAKSGNF